MAASKTNTPRSVVPTERLSPPEDEEASTIGMIATPLA